MATWYVRSEGSPTAVAVATPEEILTAVRDGQWRPTDEVKGPNDPNWVSIENHPAFSEAAEEMEHPPAGEHDETHLDMNPLIDVCLVLLIFFILTITYASLERAIEVPADEPDKKSTPRIMKPEDQARIFKVVARMEGNTAVVRVEEDVAKVSMDDKEGITNFGSVVGEKIKSLMDKTGKKEMFFDTDGKIPWGVQTAILDAAKGSGVHRIYYKPKSGK